tara:strand:- start:638 stop:973 length:336 start_codon:yes stop_codon:yes gene_type:complete
MNTIRKKKEIQRILNNGKIFKTSNLNFHYLKQEKLTSDILFLIAIPKKKIKLAVNRNYLKRVLKGCVLNNKNVFEKLNAKIKFIVIYNNSTKIKYTKLEKELLTFLGDLKQ